MANNFKVFAESTTNIYSDADFGTNQERLNGVHPNTPASSQLMNTALREACLAATALINICSNTSTTSKTVGPNSSLTNVVSYINTGLAYWANGIVKGKIQSTPSTLNGDTITLTIGNASSTQTTTVTIVNAKHALNADTSSNVSTYINNKAISNIFETDGLTVKKATQANNATTANSATSADTAEKLGTNAGSSTRPVYFSNGVPVQTGTSLGVSITGNAATATNVKSNSIAGQVLKSTGSTSSNAVWATPAKSTVMPFRTYDVLLDYQSLPAGKVDIEITINSSCGEGTYILQKPNLRDMGAIMFVKKANADYTQSVRIIGYTNTAILTGTHLTAIRLNYGESSGESVISNI